MGAGMDSKQAEALVFQDRPGGRAAPVLTRPHTLQTVSSQPCAPGPREAVRSRNTGVAGGRESPWKEAGAAEWGGILTHTQLDLSSVLCTLKLLQPSNPRTG